MPAKKKLLLHACCAPCLVAPYRHLSQKFDTSVFWFNHNIHPYTEYQKRLECLQNFVASQNAKSIVKDEYDVKKFVQDVCFREENRCQICYFQRLQYTAIIAKKGNFDFFGTTLLYSKFQNFEQIIEIGKNLAKKYGVKFLDTDLRVFWKEGIEMSKQEGMYRQQYCGCIYSEQERYLG